jgi:hypothetical protein
MEEDNQRQPLMDWLNSPELKALRKAWHDAEKLQNAEDDAWWEGTKIAVVNTHLVALKEGPRFPGPIEI